MLLADGIRIKLQHLDRTLEELRERAMLPLEEFAQSRDRVLATERLCQVAVDCAVDTCQLILELEERVPPASTKRIIEEVNQMGIIGGAVWAVLDDYIEVRNEIVHEYELTTAQRDHKEARGLVDKLPEFIREVEAYLIRKEAAESSSD